MILDLATELQILNLISEKSLNRMSEISESIPLEFPTKHIMKARVK